MKVTDVSHVISVTLRWRTRADARKNPRRLLSLAAISGPPACRAAFLFLSAIVLAAAASFSPVSRALAVSGAAQPAPVVRDVRFGINQAWEAPDASDLAGAGWSRLMFWWSAFQPTGPADWNSFATDNDSYIDDELARGRELAGVIVNTPRWASASRSPNAVPHNLSLAWDHPQNHWGRFVERLATHYRGRINAWIIWNEVDIPTGPWRAWDGPAEEYAQLLGIA